MAIFFNTSVDVERKTYKILMLRPLASRGFSVVDTFLNDPAWKIRCLTSDQSSPPAEALGIRCGSGASMGNCGRKGIKVKRDQESRKVILVGGRRHSLPGFT
jgi:hypothetical protein